MCAGVLVVLPIVWTRLATSRCTLCVQLYSLFRCFVSSGVLAPVGDGDIVHCWCVHGGAVCVLLFLLCVAECVDEIRHI